MFRFIKTSLALLTGTLVLTAQVRLPIRILPNPGGGTPPPVQDSGGGVLQPSDFTLDGYWDINVSGGSSNSMSGLTHRYVGGDLRLMYMFGGAGVVEISLAGKAFGSTIEIGDVTNQWNIGSPVYGGSNQLSYNGGEFFHSIWYEDPSSMSSRLWTTSVLSYADNSEHGHILTRTLNLDGTTSNFHGGRPAGLLDTQVQRNSPNIDFVVGETIRGRTSGSTGIVGSWNSANNDLRLSGISAIFATAPNPGGSEIVDGLTSGAVGTMIFQIGSYGYGDGIALEGISPKQYFGGFAKTPAAFQAKFGVGPYMAGWGGYTSNVAQGTSLGLTDFFFPDPAGFADYSSIPANQIKTGATFVVGTGTTTDWYDSPAPTSYDLGRTLITSVTNYFGNKQLGGTPCGVPILERPTAVPVNCTDGRANWLSPAPDGFGRFPWGNSYTESGAWITGVGKQGLVAIMNGVKGYGWYIGSDVVRDGVTQELHIWDQNLIGNIAAGALQPWKAQPTVMADWSGILHPASAYDSTCIPPTRSHTDCYDGQINGYVNSIGSTFDKTTNKWYVVVNRASTTGSNPRLYRFSVDCDSPAFIQSKHNTYVASSTAQLSIAAPAFTPSAGNAVVVAWSGFYAGVTTAVTVTDTAGNTCDSTTITQQQSIVSHGGVVGLAICPNLSGTLTNDVFTVTYSPPSQYPRVIAAEYSAIQHTSPIDTFTHGSGTTAVVTSFDFTTTHALDLLVAAVTDHSMADTWTAGLLGGVTGTIRDQIDGLMLMDRVTHSVITTLPAQATDDGEVEPYANAINIVALKALP